MVLAVSRARRARQERAQLALAQFRLGTRRAREDLTVLAQRLDDSPPWMDGEASTEWKRAAGLYAAARAALRETASVADVLAVHTTLHAAWFHLARADALAYDEEPPSRSEPCYFNPQHGPAAADVAWAPPGRRPGLIPVCRADAERIAAGLAPMFRRMLVEADAVRRDDARADLAALNSGVGWTGGMFQPSHRWAP